MGNEHSTSCDPGEIPTMPSTIFERNFVIGHKYPYEIKTPKSRPRSDGVASETIVNFIDVVKSEATLALALTTTNFAIKHVNEAFVSLNDEQKEFIGLPLNIVMGIEIAPKVMEHFIGKSSSTKTQSPPSVKFDVTRKSGVQYHVKIEACRGVTGEVKGLLWAIRKIDAVNEQTNTTENDCDTTESSLSSNNNSFTSTRSNSADMSVPEKKEKEKKKVHYNNKIRVILIPSRREYFDRGLEIDLWYSREHLNSFAQHAVKEITEYMDSITEKLTVKQVMMELYQPQYSSYEESLAVNDGVGGGSSGRVEPPAVVYYEYKVRFKRTSKTFLVRRQDLAVLRLGELLHVESTAKDDLHVGEFLSDEASYNPAMGDGVTYIASRSDPMSLIVKDELLGKYKYIIRPVTEQERISYAAKTKDEEALLEIIRTATTPLTAVTITDVEYQFNRSSLTIFFNLMKPSRSSLCFGLCSTPDSLTNQEETKQEHKMVKEHKDDGGLALLIAKVRILSLVENLLPINSRIILCQLKV
jgi:hypothetical protein